MQLRFGGGVGVVPDANSFTVIFSKVEVMTNIFFFG